MPKFFVFVESQTGPQPQVWHVEHVSGEGKEKLNPIFKYQLTLEEETAFDSKAIGLAHFVARFQSRLPQNATQA